MTPEAPPIKVRDATDDDAPRLVPLLAALGYEATADELRGRLGRYQARDTDRVLVAEVDGTLVGLVATHRAPTLHLDGESGRVAALVVLPSFQRTGLGRRLLAEAESLLLAAGCQRLELTSNVRRQGAHRFYEQQGWIGDGVRFRKPLPGS